MLTPSAIPVGPSGQARARAAATVRTRPATAAMSAARKEPQANRLWLSTFATVAKGRPRLSAASTRAVPSASADLEGAALEQDRAHRSGQDDEGGGGRQGEQQGCFERPVLRGGDGLHLAGPDSAGRVPAAAGSSRAPPSARAAAA